MAISPSKIREKTVSNPPPPKSSNSHFFVAFLVLIAAYLARNPLKHADPLKFDVNALPKDPFSPWHLHYIIAKSFIAPGDLSTTKIPISAPSPIIKHLLAGEWSMIPEDVEKLFKDQVKELKTTQDTLETVRIQTIRNMLSKERYRQVEEYCSVYPCQEIVNNGDTEFGMTPLHLLSLMGDLATEKLLIEKYKADPNVWDKYGRQPRNLTFAKFVENSKKFSKLRGDTHCELPVVDFNVPKHQLDAQFKEVKRLMYEGEPVLMRGVVQHLNPSLLSINLDELIAKDKSHDSKVGEVPYAGYFGLKTQRMGLQDYYESYVKQNKQLDHVLYVFEKSPPVTKPGLDTLIALWTRVFKDASPQLICSIEDGKNGAKESIHFFLGATGSGAPTHVHADAWNVLAKGRKHWFFHPPRESLYSKKHVVDWVKQDLPRIQAVQKDTKRAHDAKYAIGDLAGQVVGTPPLECIQESGDIAYVPFDWGHAVWNVEGEGNVNFGYALEILNRREVMSSITGIECE